MALIKCPKCGKQITDQAQICPGCMTPGSGIRALLAAQPVKKRGGIGVKVIGVLLILFGLIGVFLGCLMFGDIGIACLVGAITALLSGIGFLLVPRN